MSEKILKCPFPECGYPDEDAGVYDVYNENGKGYYVECACGARGPMAYCGEVAIDKWNAAAIALAAKDAEIADKKKIIEDMFVVSANVQAENLKLSNKLQLQKKSVAAGDKRQDELEAEIEKLRRDIGNADGCRDEAFDERDEARRVARRLYRENELKDADIIRLCEELDDERGAKRYWYMVARMCRDEERE